MKGNDKFEDVIRKNLDVRAGDRAYNRMRDAVLDTHGQSKQKPSAVRLTIVRRTIMKSPIVKLAVAAVIIAAVVLGIFEYIGTNSKSGVVWAEVAKKVEASRGLILRCTETKANASNEEGYSIKYFSPTHSRTDSYKGGLLTQTFYDDFETMTLTAVFHTHKHYMSRKLSTSEGFLEKHEDWMNPRYLVQTILSCEHTELGQKTIAGVLCEGLETTDPAALGPLPGPVSRLDVQMRLWVNAETEYPVLFEGKITAEVNGQVMGSECVMDQFQWDVELDPSLLEPNIPSDYTDMRKL